MNIALLSILTLLLLFVVGAFKRNPLNLGVLAIFICYLLGSHAGMKSVAIMQVFPTVLFVRIFGILLFFSVVQNNGSLELLAKKILAVTGKNTKMLPFIIFYVGVLLGSIGINSLAGMAILSGIGISLALSSDGNPLLHGIAGGYGIAVGCYSPINEYTTNIVAAANTAGYNNVELMPIYLYCVIGFSLSFAVIYFLMGGHKARGSVKGESILGELPAFTKRQLISLSGIIGVLLLVVFLKLDVGVAGIVVAVACVLLGCCKCDAAIRGVSLPVLILVCGVGMLVNLISKLGGFAIVGSALSAVMSTDTVAPLMSLSSSVMSLFTLSRVCVLTLIPTIPGIAQNIPAASVELAIAATSAGAFASCIGPLSSCGALIMQNLSQQMGEEQAIKYFVPQQIYAIIGAFVLVGYAYAASVLVFFR
ncbi:MAG: hypothetical protein LBQ10_11735 [Desulfovibrio sp.]|jgi:di/tricarboxylate transporter|nr:hypothetical protein [Desulfovibrio sp.]